MLVLLFNVLGAGAMPAHAEDGGMPRFAQEMTGDRFVVCTAAGMVVVDRNGNVVETDASIAGGISCVFCLPLMHGGVEAPALVAVIAADTAETPSDFALNESASLIPARLPGAASPRAPPLA